MSSLSEMIDYALQQHLLTNGIHLSKTGKQYPFEKIEVWLAYPRENEEGGFIFFYNFLHSVYKVDRDFRFAFGS